MKKLNFLFILLAVVLLSVQTQAQRYETEVFSDVTIDRDIVYGQNVTVLTLSDPNIAAPVLRPLVLDLYHPTGDTETDRPLVLMFKTGNFLPNPQNGGINGTRNDSVNVEIATRLAKMGYVVANVDYRLGWNPLATTQNDRVYGLINASYRGIQDARTSVRFFKKTVAEDSNPYGVDPNKIVMWGNGTGGYVVLGAATMDTYAELVLPKFIGTNTLPMVIESVNGDIYGTSYGIVPPGGGALEGDTLCVPNHVGYSSDFQLCVNMGGALGDTSWLNAGDPPMISYQVPTDPFAPYTEAVLIVPTTGDLIVEVQGAYVIAQRANALGNNDVFNGITDDFGYTAAANANNDGYEGLFPFVRYGVPQSGPWDWWDAAHWSQFPHPSCGAVNPPDCSFHTINSLSAPNMSIANGNLYVDSIIGYFAPRAIAALSLTVGVEEVLQDLEVNLTMLPNPATSYVDFRTDSENPILDIQVFDLSGRLVKAHTGINTNQFTMQRNSLSAGLYIAKIRFEKGIVAKKVLFQ